MRKVCMAVIDRANWGRCQTVAEAIQAHPSLELEIVCGGTMPLNRFKRPADVVRAQGFNVAEEHFHEIEGSVPVSMARSGGLAQMDFAGAFERIKPDLVYLVGDRYQAVGVAMAAVTLGIPLVHQQGGEVSGALDERYRHAISKLADMHVPATEQARDNILRMGESPDSILAIGCPAADLAARVTPKSERFILVVYHPNTVEYGHAAAEMREVLLAVHRSQEKAMLLWPNVDAGADSISKAIRQFRDLHSPSWEYVTNLEPEEYLNRLASASCCCGNSSSFVRDAGYFGTPIVLVGNRQQGRECGENVTRVPCCSPAILQAIQLQIMHGKYPPSDLYGSPGVSERIAARLATVPLIHQKRLAYELEAAA